MVDLGAATLPRRIVVVLSGLWAVALLIVFAMRVGHPLELEWMEGGALHQALRIQHGEPTYGPPSAEFVPFLYTPLYPLVLAVLGFVLPLGYTLGRLVSVAAFVAIGWALWRAVRAEGKPTVHAIAAVGLWCSGYVFTFRWLDLARADTLFMALVLWGLVVLRGAGTDKKRAVIAGVLVALAFWTKQTTAVFVIASGLAALLVAPRTLWIYALTIAVIDGGGVLVGNLITDGWLWTYVYELHQSHDFNRERFTSKTWGMFLHAAPFLVALVVWRVVTFARTRGPADTGASAIGLVYWGLMACAGLLVSALGYATQWAEPNAFIPGVGLGALFVAVAIPDRGRFEAVALALVCAQLVFSLLIEPRYQPIQDDGLPGVSHSYAWQDPARTIPTTRVRGLAEERRDQLEAETGEVFALHRPWWNVLAGGGGHVGRMGLHDVAEADQRRLRTALRGQFEEVRYAQVWVEGEPPPWLRRALVRHYRLDRRIQGDDRVRPMSGFMSDAGMVERYLRDQLVFAPMGPRERPDGTRVVADFETGSLDGFVRRGRAFPPRPTRGLRGSAPAVGPHGGEFLLSGAASPKGTGSIESPIFELTDAAAVECLLGVTKPSDALRAEIVEVAPGDRVARLQLPDVRYGLEVVRWPIPDEWRGTQVRLRLSDTDPKGAMMLDDLWLVR